MRTFRLIAGTSLALVLLGWTAAAQPPAQPDPEKSDAPRGPARVEVRFVDDSQMKLILLDENVELVSRYGTLTIPTAEIVKIEFATRIPDDVALKIDKAVADLGHFDYKRRDVASHDLAEAGEASYAALVRAAKHNDLEVSRRAEELLLKLRLAVPAHHLEVRENDVVYTADSKNTGRLKAAVLRVKTVQFGEQPLKLSDLRSLQASAARDLLAEALPDPGTLTNFSGQVGKIYVFKVTGAAQGRGNVWGTEVYTTDSVLAVAAVHTGVLQPGQTGAVRVTFLGPVQEFQGFHQNGVMSGGYGPFTGYRVHK
jgi:hypothetical protein